MHNVISLIVLFFLLFNNTLFNHACQFALQLDDPRNRTEHYYDRNFVVPISNSSTINFNYLCTRDADRYYWSFDPHPSSMKVLSISNIMNHLDYTPGECHMLIMDKDFKDLWFEFNSTLKFGTTLVTQQLVYFQ